MKLYHKPISVSFPAAPPFPPGLPEPFELFDPISRIAAGFFPVESITAVRRIFDFYFLPLSLLRSTGDGMYPGKAFGKKCPNGTFCKKVPKSKLYDLIDIKTPNPVGELSWSH